MSKEVSPTYAEIVERCKALAGASSVVEYSEIGPSGEKRPIPVVTAGDINRDFPLMLVAGGMHGSEEAGRAVGMAFAEWLAGEGADYLHKLSAVIIPCANPDGSLRNTYHNAEDVNVYTSFRFKDKSTTPEGRAIEALAAELIPDCYVDLHGLAGGAMGDSQYIHPTLPSNMGLQNSFFIAEEMNDAARKLGYPQRRPHIHGAFRDDATCLPGKLATEMNTLCFTVETTECYYPIADTVASGLARMKVLADVGARTGLLQPYPGFPCDVITGSSIAALMPIGNTYRRRRESRVKTMAAILESDMCTYTRLAGDPGRTAIIELIFDEKSKTFPEGVVFQAAFDPRVEIKSVEYEWPDGFTGQVPVVGEDCIGREDEEETGYFIWTEKGSSLPLVHVMIAQSPGVGKNVVKIKYDAPFKRHVALPERKNK